MVQRKFPIRHGLIVLERLRYEVSYVMVRHYVPYRSVSNDAPRCQGKQTFRRLVHQYEPMFLVGYQNSVVHRVQDHRQTLVFGSHGLQQLLNLFTIELGKLFQGPAYKASEDVIATNSRSKVASGFTFRVAIRSQ